MDRPNLTVLSEALVTRVFFEGKRASGVEFNHGGKTTQVRAGLEVVLSLGAINTPKVLMQSGVGDQSELVRLGIPMVQHLPGVGRNFQDHVAFGCVWESWEAHAPCNNAVEAGVFWKSESGLDHPDLFGYHVEVPVSSEENAARFGLPEAGWSFFATLALPKSRGRLRLAGCGPNDPILIEANMLGDPEDIKTATACVNLFREIGNSRPLRPFAKREVMPGTLKGAQLEDFIRNAATTSWHETCTAKMGRDEMSVVDSRLKVYGVENLRIADGSIMPRIATGNTMAPCVVIGELAADFVRASYGL
jgi:choline dehydrogenase